MYLFQLFHEYFWRKNRYHYILVKTIFYTTPQKIGLRSPPMNGGWLYLPPPRNETSVTREYKRAPPWIGGELQRLRLTKSHRVGHLQRAQGDICIYVISFICREAILFLCTWLLYTIILSVQLPKQYSGMPKQLWHQIQVELAHRYATFLGSWDVDRW